MIFNIVPHEKKIFDIIRSSAKDLGMPVYVVGGYVRDRLLSRNSQDLDVVCVGDSLKLADLVASQLYPKPHVAVFQRFGTAMIKHSNVEIEFVGARKESYSTMSRKPDVEQGTIEDDQNRRDFTINALAVSLNDDNYGEIIDPFNGLRHLEMRLLKTPLNPDKTFSDDPLRMMRAIRFATQLDFKIDAETLASITKNKHRIHIVSKERISKELEKIILSTKPSKGFKLLFDCGLLQLIFSEMSDLQGVDIINNIGHKDNFYHTLEVLDNVSKESTNVWLRWAAILHDIAKPQTKRFDPNIGWTFHGHEALGAAMVPRIFKKLRLPLDVKMKYVQKLVALHLRPIALTNDKVSDSAVRRLLFDAGEDLDDLMLLCRADITSKNEGKVQKYLENYNVLEQKIIDIEHKDHIRNWQPPIGGEEIMNIFKLQPSREVGVLKNAIKDAILDGQVANTYDDALDFLKKKAKELGIHYKN